MSPMPVVVAVLIVKLGDCLAAEPTLRAVARADGGLRVGQRIQPLRDEVAHERSAFGESHCARRCWTGFRAWRALEPLTSARLADLVNAESSALVAQPSSGIFFGFMASRMISWTL